MSTPNGSPSLHGPLITAEVLQSSAAQAGVKVPEKWEADFTELLAGARNALEQVVAMEDFVIQPDLERFPRKDIYRPTPDDNPYNAWATRATVQDTKADEASPAGILAGNTVVLKDNICLAGVPCEFGTKVFEDWVPKTDATVVTRVLEAGGVIIGKATCENFCAYGVSNTAAHGPVGNPHDKTRSSGGSSSGCGVLVAIGEADMAIGGDQGGSIRIPASHVGIVGLKPTYGLVPYTGIISSDTLVDHAGPMTRDVITNAQLLQAIAGVEGLDDRQIAGTPYKENVPNYVALLSAARTAHALLSVPEKTPEFAPGMTRKMRLGILKEADSVFGMDPRVAACVRIAAGKFEEIGGEVVEVSVPGHAQGGVLGRVERIMSNNLLGRLGGTRQMYMTDLVEKMLPWTQDKFEKLWFTSSSALVQGLYAEKNYPFLHAKVHNLIRKLKLDYDTALSDVDVLIMPTLPWVAKKLLPKDASPLEHFNDYNGLVGNTVPFDLTGHPALSIPCGMLPPPEGPDDLRLPVGMQLVGRFQDELMLYKAALAWSDAFDWKTM